jgi:predicted transcriptional regulator
MDKAKTNYAIPGESMSQEEFEKMIAEAEKGPFHTIKEVKAEVSKWKVKYSKWAS